MGKCCDESNCRRSTPILIRRGGFSGRWFVITAYKPRHPDLPRSYIESTVKHDVTDELTAQLIGAGWTPPTADD